jgi:hypothetical protein
LAENKLREERSKNITLEHEKLELSRKLEETALSLKEQVALERRRVEATKHAYEDKLKELDAGQSRN